MFLEKIMQETLHDHHTSISIGGRPIAIYDLPTTSNLWAAALQDRTNIVIDRATTYGKKVSTEKSKIMTNSTNNISADISMSRGDQFQLAEVTSFKYLRASLCKDGTCSAELRIRIA